VPSRVDQLHRFERLGLNWNPFRTVATSEKPDVYIPDLYRTTALARDVALTDSPFTQVIGRAGHGKSTFLTAVADALDKAGVPGESHYLQPLLWTRVAVPGPDVRVLILDEAERLSWWNLSSLLRWTRRGGRLIVSSHRDLSGRFSHSALRPVTITFPVVTVEGLQEFFLTRLRWAGHVDGRFDLTTDGADWLLAVSEGNLRVVEAVLYEIFQVAADEFVSCPGSSAGQSAPLRIDSERLNPLEEFAKRRAAFEAEGNIPFSRLRLLTQSIRTAREKIADWLSGRTSTPGPAERELPR